MLDRFTTKSLLKNRSTDLNKVYAICKHEIALLKTVESGNHNLAANFYKWVAIRSMFEFNDMNMQRKEKAIPAALKHIEQSTTVEQAMEQFLKLYDPYHELRFAVEMQYEIQLEFENPDCNKSGRSANNYIHFSIEQRILGLKGTYYFSTTDNKRLYNQTIVVPDKTRFK